MKQTKFLMTVLLLYVVLGSWKGYLALYEGSESEPSRIYPQKIEALPEDDQYALEQGILIRNQERLSQLLEDYLS